MELVLDQKWSALLSLMRAQSVLHSAYIVAAAESLGDLNVA